MCSIAFDKHSPTTSCCDIAITAHSIAMAPAAEHLDDMSFMLNAFDTATTGKFESATNR